MSIYAKGPKGRADRLFSQLIRSRGACENCGQSNPDVLQCAHIIRRGLNATRTDEKNAWCLCSGCHTSFTHRLEEHMAFVERSIGMDAYWELRAKAQAGVKVSDKYWLAECERLTALLKEAA